MKSFKEFLIEKAPPGKKAEEWIKKNKSEFKKEYGDEWEEVLYATAWKIFGESIETIDIGVDTMLEEMSTAASTGTSGVAMPDARPMFKKSKFMGHPTIEVDDETYSKFMQGKQPFKRWKNYTGDSALHNELKDMYKKNKRLLVMNQKTRGMVFIK